MTSTTVGETKGLNTVKIRWVEPSQGRDGGRGGFISLECRSRILYSFFEEIMCQESVTGGKTEHKPPVGTMRAQE